MKKNSNNILNLLLKYCIYVFNYYLIYIEKYYILKTNK